MEIIKNKKGIKYREKIYFNGKEIKSPSFRLKTDAKSWKVRMQNQRDRNISLATIQPEKVLFSDYVEIFLSFIKSQRSNRTYLEYQSLSKLHLLPYFKATHLHEINKGDGDKIISALIKKGKSEKGINLVIGLLKRILNFAVEAGLLEVNQVNRCKFLKEKPRPDVFFSKLEIKQFLSATRKDVYYSLFVIAFNTGLRKSELAGLKWDRVNFENGLFEITRTRDKYGVKETTKSHEKRVVPINSACRKELETLLSGRRHSEFIFLDSLNKPFGVNQLYREFKKAQKVAGFQRDFRFHDIRHSFASHYMMSGGNVFDLQKILGHSTIEMTQRYAHLCPMHLSGATENLNFEMDSRPDLGHEVESTMHNLVILNR